MFLQTVKEIGEVKVGETKIIKFPYTSLEGIKRYQATCDCTSVHNDTVDECIVITYKAKDIPEHLRREGKTRYAIRKEVKIFFEVLGNPSEVALVFTGIVKK